MEPEGVMMVQSCDTKIVNVRIVLNNGGLF